MFGSSLDITSVSSTLYKNTTWSTKPPVYTHVLVINIKFAELTEAAQIKDQIQTQTNKPSEINSNIISNNTKPTSGMII